MVRPTLPPEVVLPRVSLRWTPPPPAEQLPVSTGTWPLVHCPHLALRHIHRAAWQLLRMLSRPTSLVHVAAGYTASRLLVLMRFACARHCTLWGRLYHAPTRCLISQCGLGLVQLQALCLVVPMFGPIATRQSLPSRYSHRVPYRPEDPRCGPYFAAGVPLIAPFAEAPPLWPPPPTTVYWLPSVYVVTSRVCLACT